MFALNRIALPTLNAFVITSILLYLMFLLIKSDDPGLLEKAQPLKFQWPTPPEDTPPEILQPRPPAPPKVDVRPVVPSTQDKFLFNPGKGFAWVEPTIEGEQGVLPQPFDKPLVLAIGYQARYPDRALRDGVEGYVVVGFSVTASGEVFDPFETFALKR